MRRRRTQPARDRAGVGAMRSLRRLGRHAVVESIVLLALAIVLALTLQAYAVKPYKIPSPSMEPTLKVGDRVLVDRFSHRILGGTPHIGDVGRVPDQPYGPVAALSQEALQQERDRP